MSSVAALANGHEMFDFSFLVYHFGNLDMLFHLAAVLRSWVTSGGAAMPVDRFTNSEGKLVKGFVQLFSKRSASDCTSASSFLIRDG